MALFGQYTDSVVIYSLLANATILIILFLSGMGRKIWQRFRQKFQYQRGGYVNTVFVRKDGTAKEIFKKVGDDKTVQLGGKDKYAIDRRRTVTFEGIPTMLHIEGTAEPASWDNPQHAMSTGEITQIIENNQKDDILAQIAAAKPYILIGAVVLAGAIAAGLYFNWQIYDQIVQKGAQLAAGR